MKTHHILNVCFLIIAQLASAQPTIPDLQTKPVTFTVVDSEGKPLEGVLIEASRPGPGNAEGTTDDAGQLVLDLPGGASLSVHAYKFGYYKTGGELWRGGMYRGPEGRLVAREMPDAFTIELKEVRHAVYMRNERFRGIAPVAEEPVGYDFRVGDWVAPYGKGVTEDIRFHFTDLYIDEESYAGTMVVSFPNEGDGIQPFTAARPFSMEFGSNLAPPHKAPIDGYQPGLSYSVAHREGESYQGYKEKGRNYIFRTRTVLDPQGKILQACYGWILGEIEFDPRDPRGPQLAFAYYFNPDPDPEERSLEYNLYVPREIKDLP
jgi:hypothetical protein